MGEAFTSVLAAVWGAITDVVGTITNAPLLLIPLGMTFAAGGIGLAKSLMGTKRGKRR